MTVQEKMAQLQAVKADIKQALINKGIDMAGVPFTEYAGKIGNLGKSLDIFNNGQHCLPAPQVLENETKTTIGIADNKLNIRVVNTGSLSKFSCVTFNGGNKIDVTDYSLAVVYFDAKLTNTYGNFYLYVGDAQNPNNVSDGGKTSDRIQDKNNVTMSAIVDISDVTGLKYINVYCSGYQSAMGIDVIKLVLI